MIAIDVYTVPCIDYPLDIDHSLYQYVRIVSKPRFDGGIRSLLWGYGRNKVYRYCLSEI